MILGETYTDRVSVYDVDGAPGSAGTVTGVVTLPDATTAAPTILEAEEGQYDIDYVPTIIGRHEMVVTATGGVLGSVVRKLFRTFYVDPANVPWLVSLADSKTYLNIPEDRTVNDDELQHFIGVASEFVESRTRLWHADTVTEQHTFPKLGGENVIILRKAPVVTVTSVVEGGTTLAASYYSINPVGNYIWRTSGWWTSPVNVTYTVGSSIVPLRVRHAVLVVLKHLWTTQRGPLTVARQGGEEVYDPRSAYSFPRSVAEILEDLGGASNLYVG